MSNTNDINFKATAGDTQGHGFKSGRIDDGSGIEADGPALPSRGRLPIKGGSTEGHGFKSGRIDDGSGDEADGASGGKV